MYFKNNVMLLRVFSLYSPFISQSPGSSYPIHEMPQLYMCFSFFSNGGGAMIRDGAVIR